MDHKDTAPLWLIEYTNGDTPTLLGITRDPEPAMMAIDVMRARLNALTHHEWMQLTRGSDVQAYHLILPRFARLQRPSLFCISRWQDDSEASLGEFLNHYACVHLLQEDMEDALQQFVEA